MKYKLYTNDWRDAIGISLFSVILIWGLILLASFHIVHPIFLMMGGLALHNFGSIAIVMQERVKHHTTDT